MENILLSDIFRRFLRYNNKTTNAYISPHLIRFNERFELKDERVDNETLLNTLINIKDKNDK